MMALQIIIWSQLSASLLLKELVRFPMLSPQTKICLYISWLGKLPAISNYNRLAGRAGLGTDALDGLHDIHTLGDVAEDNVLTVQPIGLHRAEKKLGTVGARTGVRHGEDTRAGVLEREILIGELLTVDGLTAGAVTAGEITTLAPKIVNHAMEGGSLKVQRLAGTALPLLTGAERAEILGRLWNDVRTKGHLDATSGLSADGHVEANNWV